MGISLNKENLHHAYCIIGEAENTLSELQKFLEKDLNFAVQGNPDFWYGEYDTMDIEDGRAIKELHYNQPTKNDKKVFVLQANFITEKAQNAMLKLFEEPIGGTHFFIIMPSTNCLIATLKSRLIIIEHKNNESTQKIKAKEFLKSSIGERMEMIKGLSEDIKDEKESKIEVVNFFNGLEKELSKNIDLKDRALVKALENIEKMRLYAGEQSPSLKMLMEYLALILPTL
jgi:DNA polymerase III delta prime subunit